MEWAGPCFTREGTWGWERVQRQLNVFRPGLYCPSGERQLSKPSPHLPWHYAVLRAYESLKGRGDGKGGWWTSRFRSPLGHKGSAWGHTLHQLIHGPETGEATGSCSLAKVFFFFLNLHSTVLHYEWPGR